MKWSARLARHVPHVPAHYGIGYEINPWMDVRRQTDRTLARSQWGEFERVLSDEVGAAVRTCAPRPGLPDMVFTANVRGAYWTE